MHKIKIKLISLFLLPIYFLSSSVVPVFAAVNYLYDANGNMTSDGNNCYTYNDSNQLAKVTNCNSGQIIAQYLYDYQGNRIVKKIYNNGTLQKTVYSPNDGYETVKLASNSATQNTTYYQVNDETLAKKNPDGSKNYYLNDNLGSTNILTNQAGAITEKTTYYPYGQIRTGGTQSKYLYTGQENDPETGLDYYNARYYASNVQHFTQPDDRFPNQYDPQQLNRYSYVTNNPLTKTDPTGHDAIYFVDPNGANGAGHSGYFYQDPGGTWHKTYFGPASNIVLDAMIAATRNPDVAVPAVFHDDKVNENKDTIMNQLGKDNATYYHTSKEQDAKITAYSKDVADGVAGKVKNKNDKIIEYSLLSNNCKVITQNAFKKININATPHETTSIPNERSIVKKATTIIKKVIKR